MTSIKITNDAWHIKCKNWSRNLNYLQTKMILKWAPDLESSRKSWWIYTKGFLMTAVRLFQYIPSRRLCMHLEHRCPRTTDGVWGGSLGKLLCTVRCLELALDIRHHHQINCYQGYTHCMPVIRMDTIPFCNPFCLQLSAFRCHIFGIDR